MFPRTNSVELRSCIVFLVLLCVGIAARNARLAIDGNWVALLIAAGIWIPLAVGLWLLHPLARKVTIAVLWILVIVAPVGLINPFAALNDYAPDFPSVGTLVAYIYPFVACGVYLLHVLIKYKSEFRTHAAF